MTSPSRRGVFCFFFPFLCCKYDKKSKKIKKNQKKSKKMRKNLHNSKICCNFAPSFKKEMTRNTKKQPNK